MPKNAPPKPAVVGPGRRATKQAQKVLGRLIAKGQKVGGTQYQECLCRQRFHNRDGPDLKSRELEHSAASSVPHPLEPGVDRPLPVGISVQTAR